MNKKFSRSRKMIVEKDCYYSIKKVADYFDTSVETLKRDIDRGNLKGILVGVEGTKILGSEILRYENEREINGGKK